MSDLPKIIEHGERARLFPVLAETSKEGRTLSILLSCIENVHELGRGLLSDLGVRVGTRTQIETYTEVVFPKTPDDKALRPDGLIIVRKNGAVQWSAIVEAKVGKNQLTADQIEDYLDIAKKNSVDALITISNEFAPLPTHHPVQISSTARKKATLYHWSWMYILTESKLLLDNSDVSDVDQRVILNEMVRFLSHDSAGVKSFDQMPSAWTDVVSTTQTGGALAPSSAEVKEVIGAWHQETRDLSLILSRQLACNVEIKVQRAHSKDHTLRTKADTQTLCSEKCLKTTFRIPDAASLMDICADLQTKTISVSMKLRAPDDRKSTKARLNWLLRQIQDADAQNIHLRLYWPGRGAPTQFPLSQLRSDQTIADEKANTAVTSFEVILVKDCGARFGQRKNFIVELESSVPEFYEQVGQFLRAWQPPAPRLRDDKTEIQSVDTSSMQKESSIEALIKDDRTP